MSEAFLTRLHQIVGRIAPPLREQGRRDAAAVLAAGARSDEGLLRLLRTKGLAPRVRASACWVLGRFGEARCKGALVEALDDEAPEVRQAAAHALGELGCSSAVASLLTLLEDDSTEVRCAAVFALGLIGDVRATGPLTRVLGNRAEEPRVRGMAAEALVDLRAHGALPHLADALTDPSPEVRYWAAFSVGELGDQDMLSVLENLANTDSAAVPGRGAVSEEARFAMARIRERTGTD